MTMAITAEWRKIVTLRSTYLILVAALVLGAGLGVADTMSIAAHWPTMDPADKLSFDAVGDSFTGFTIAQLGFGLLGVMVIAPEYATGMINTTLTAIPRRGTMFAAKAIVTGGLTLVAGQVFAFAAFLAGQAALSRAGLNVHPGEPGVLRAVTGAGLYLFVVAMLGLGMGALVRHPATAIAILFALVFLAYGAGRALETWSYLPDRLLLVNASSVVAQVHAYSPKPRLPSLAMAYADLGLYLVAALGLGLWRVRRDA